MEAGSKKRLWLSIVMVFLISSSVFSFFKYYNRKLDGDIVNIVLPIDSYRPVLNDPLAIQAVFRHQSYSGTNRWFCHQSMRFIFLKVYKAVTIVCKDKVKALYLCNTIGFLASHVLLLVAMSLYVVSFRTSGFVRFLFAAAFLTPFFHMHENMNLMDPNITYVVFYTFPLSLILFFFYPFYKYLITGEASFFSSGLNLTVWAVLGFCNAFSSSSNPVIGSAFGVLIIGSVIFEHYTKKENKVPGTSIRNMLILISLFVLLCSYSYYAGTFNNENNHDHSLGELYTIFFANFLKFFGSFQFVLMYLYIGLGLFFVREVKLSREEDKQFTALKIILAACLLYVLLLPIGGYRSYRPMILRSDITMPFSAAMILFTSFLSILLLSRLGNKSKKIFTFITLVILSIFYFSDVKISKEHALEKRYLNIIQQHKSREPLVLPSNTSILSWKNIEIEDQYHNIALMLYQWGITDTVRPYTQQ